MSDIRTVDDVRAHLERLLQAPDPYPFLTVVEDYLAAVPGDDQMRAKAVGLLVKKGLLSVAAELAQGCPADSPNAGELRRAADQLAAAQTDLIDPRTTEDHFAANRAVLRGRGGLHSVLSVELERTWRECGGQISLHRARDGNLLARARRSDGRRIWVPAALDFANQAEVLQGHEAWPGSMLKPFLMEGVGMGWLLPRLHAATKWIYLTYSPALFVVEPNLQALAVALALHDWAEVLADQRVYVFGGPQAWERWRELMRGDDTLAVPPAVMRLMPWPGSPPVSGEQVRQEVAGERGREEKKAIEAATGSYGPRDRTWWARRYASAGAGDPLRVLAVTSRFTTFLQHSARDLLAAFALAGCRTRLLIEPHDHALLSRQTYMEVFAQFQPDLVVMIDHHRQELPDRFPRNVPFVCWIQDDLPPLFEAAVGPRMHEFDFTIGYGLTRCVLGCGYPRERFMPCRMAVDLEKFGPRPGEGPDESLGCDVVFVSHHSEPPEALHDRLRAKAGHPQLAALMDAFYEQTRPLMTSPRFNAGYDLEELLRQVEAQAGIGVPPGPARDRLMSRYVRPLADRTIRHATLAWIADWADATGRRLHLYGRGWEQHGRFGKYARGEAGHGEHLARIARNAAINLHTGSSLALHQRVLETLAAGGFVMVRFHPQDFHPPGYESLRRFLVDRDVREPVRIPHDELPAEFVEGRRRRLAQMGRPIPDYLEITPEYLLEQDPRRGDDRRYDFADLAFDGFERITFDGPDSFAQRAEHFLKHPDQRQEIVGQMQASVRELFTYDALVRRIIAFIRGGLEQKRSGSGSG